MTRERSAKDLSRRVDRDYFEQPDPWRRALGWTSAAAVLTTALVIAYFSLPSERGVWSKGTGRDAHAFVADDCGACHGALADGIASAARQASAPLEPLRRGRGGFGDVDEAKCSRCHAGPAHHEHAPLPSCVSCHAEHEPERSDSASCSECHAALARVWAETHVRDVHGFPDGHPEFAVLQHPDPIRLALNHDVHSWPGLRGPNGPEPLACAACHEPDTEGRGFAPISYDKHCARCHQLELPGNPRVAPIPHGDVKRALAFLEQNLPSSSEGTSRVASAWAELTEQTCSRCHTLQAATRPDWVDIEPVRASNRFLPSARFGHRSHRELACTACHGATTSRSSADVLIPSVQLCGSCHQAGAAPNRCQDCHRYHGPEADIYGPGHFTVPE